LIIAFELVVYTMVFFNSVLRIRDVYPGSEFFSSQIPDPNFFHPGCRIRIKKFKYFNPKKLFLNSRKYGTGSVNTASIAPPLAINDERGVNAPRDHVECGAVEVCVVFSSRIPDPNISIPVPGSA
jgi:hypothetical protein